MNKEKTNKKSGFSLRGTNARKYAMVIVLLAIWAIFSILTNGLFTSSRNLSNLFMQMCTVGILTCGMMFIMVTGNIDISLGSVLGTLGALVAVLIIKLDVNPVLATIITLVTGILVGLWHGYWIAYRNVPAMIATLASMTAFKGITLGITAGITISGFPELYKQIGQGYLPKLFLKDANFNDTSLILIVLISIAFVIMDQRTRKSRIEYGFKVSSVGITILKEAIVCLAILAVGSIMVSYRGIPVSILILMIVAYIFNFIANKTPYGRSIYAIGGNKEAARFSGINIRRNMLVMYAVMGLLTAVAALVYTTRLNAATTSAGQAMEMDVIAACVIGGTSPAGGIGTIFGGIIGALVMASLDNGMSLLNLDIMYQYVIKGLVLLLAVAIDAQSRKKGN